MFDRYAGNDNQGKPKKEYLEKLRSMDLVKLKSETEDKIWLSGYAANNPRSDYHWHVDACYDVIKEKTGDTKIYKECYENVLSRI